MLLENYEEYAKHARLLTGIHALKPKPKFKTGAISESTAVNVGQSNTSVCTVDQKNAVSCIVQPLAPSSNTMKGGSGQDQPTTAAAANSAIEIGVSSGSAAPVAMHKKEGGLSKTQADKKKIDARKKSLKRL